MLKEKRISVIMNCRITDMRGDTKLEKIFFRREEDNNEVALVRPEGVTDYFLKPDVLIVENGLGEPKVDINELLEKKDSGAVMKVGIDPQTRLPASNIRFSLIYNDIMSPLYAAGSCTQYPSFMHKIRVRTDDVKYNIESGFYAAMNMLDK